MQFCSKSTLHLNVAEVKFWSPLTVDELHGDVEIRLRYGRIPVELKRLICSEPKDRIRAAMKYVSEQIIAETLIDYSLNELRPGGRSAARSNNEQSIRRLVASHQSINLRSSSIQWQDNSRIHALSEDLRKKFNTLCGKITFHQCDTNFMAQRDRLLNSESWERYGETVERFERLNDSKIRQVMQSGEAQQSEPVPSVRVGDCERTYEHIRSKAINSECQVSWPLDWEAQIPDIETVPTIIVVLISGNEKWRSGRDGLGLGVTIVRTSQLFMRASEAYKLTWKSIHSPLCYKVNIPRTAEERIFHTMWRAIEFVQEKDGASVSREFSEKMAQTILYSIRKDGDEQRLESGATVRCSYLQNNALFFGEICLRSLTVLEDSEDALDLTPHHQSGRRDPGLMIMRTIREYQEYLNTHVRSETDMYGGAMMPYLYNPNLNLPDARVGQSVAEVKRYNETCIFERYQDYLDVQGLLRWRDFLAGAPGEIDPPLAQETIEGGLDQWIAFETAYETTTDDVPWPGNWLHSVNYQLARQAPRYLIEVWVGEEFGGELLLPELHELAAHQRSLWRLVEDASFGGGVTRKDYRKQTAPVSVKGWIYLNASWDTPSPREGLLKLELRELRNISTKSIKENDVMPGAPQVIVWQLNPIKKEWSLCGRFQKFEHALYFLSDNKAEDMMGELWQWDNLVLGPQPQWFNYFSWSKPGKMKSISQELPIQIVQKTAIRKNLHFQQLTTLYTNTRGQIWNLCRLGIPSILRPYLWSELVGAYCTRKFLNSWYRKNVDPDAESAYDLIMQTMLCAESPLFACIEDDIEIFASSYGLATSHKEAISRIIRSLMLFCSTDDPSSLVQDLHGRSLKLIRGSDIGICCALQYTVHLIRVCYYLSLDFASQRMTEEDMFHILLNLFAVDPAPDRSIPRCILRAPFLKYFRKAPGRFYSSDTTSQLYGETILLRLIFQRFQPVLFELIASSGFNIETTFAPILGSLFASCLPTHSLFRLWDLVFNTAWNDPDILRTPIAEPALSKICQKVKGRQRSDRAPNSPSNSPIPAPTMSSSMSSTPTPSRHDRTRSHTMSPLSSSGLRDSLRPNSGLNSTSLLLSETKVIENAGPLECAEILFDGSSSRLILFALAYQVLKRATEILPNNPTADEVNDAVISVLKGLLNPCDILLYIDSTVTEVFRGRAGEIVNRLVNVWRMELHERQGQLGYAASVGSVVEKMIVDSEALYVLGYDMNSAVSRHGKVYGKISDATSSDQYGLTTDQLYRVIYPASKYHCLFANPDIRRLPPGTQGRLVLHLTRVNILGEYDQPPFELVVSFQECIHRSAPKTVLLSSAARDLSLRSKGNKQWRCYELIANNICILYIDTPPPYNIRLALKDIGSGEIIAKQKQAMILKKLTTQGSPALVLKSSAFCGASEVEIHLRYTLNVPTNDLFLPDIDGRSALTTSALKPGCGRWGDVMPFDPMYVRVSLAALPESALSENIFQSMSSDSCYDPFLYSRDLILEKFKPINRPRCFSGFNRLALEDLMAFILPCGLQISEEIVATFGRLRDKNNFQTAFSTAVSYREILTTLIMLSSGSLLAKLELLFDLYGHNDPEKLAMQQELGESAMSGSNILYYHCTNSVPDAPSTTHYKQMAAAQNLYNVATRTAKFLPEDCPEEVLNNLQIIRNAISMHEIVGLVSEIFTKNGVHLNGMDLIRYCFMTFDSLKRMPRILGATLRSTEPIYNNASLNAQATDLLVSSNLDLVSEDFNASDGARKTNSPTPVSTSSISPASRRNPVGGNAPLAPSLVPMPFRLFNICADVGHEFSITRPVDVTPVIAAWFDKSCAETEWLGLNFFKYNTLKSLGLGEDYWPGSTKKLDIIITPTGDLQDVSLISADVDEAGNITGGQGGNYLMIANTTSSQLSQNSGLEEGGAWSVLRSDLFVREGDKSLLSICYAFDLSAFVYDKFHFFMSVLSASLITDCLRRSCVYTAKFATLQPLNVTCYMNVPFSANFHKDVLGLSFKNLQPGANKLGIVKPRSISTAGGDHSLPTRRDDRIGGNDIGIGQYPESYGSNHERDSVSDDIRSLAYGVRDDVIVTDKNTREFVGESLHGSVIRQGDITNLSRLNKPYVIVAVKRVGKLHYSDKICDIIIQCNYEDESDQTDLKQDVDTSGDIEFEDKFLYYLKPGKTKLVLHVLDASENNDQDIMDLADELSDNVPGRVIGSLNLDFSSLIDQARFQAHFTLPLMNNNFDVGEVEVSLGFLGINGQTGSAIDGAVSELIGAKTERHIQVQIIRGLKLPNEISPYCQVASNNDVFRTRTVESVDSGQALWNDTFSFNINDERFITVKVFDDQGARDCLLGEGAIDITALSSDVMKIPIVDDGRAAAQHAALTLSTSSQPSEGQMQGYVEMLAQIFDGPLTTPDIFDWGSGNVRLIVERAVNLPPAVNARALKPYVVIELEKQRDQTCEAETIHPTWQTAFTYQCKSGASNSVFSVCALNSSGEDVILGQGQINMADAKRRSGVTGKYNYKLSLDGLCRVTGGELWVNVEFIAYPSNLDKYQFVRVSISGIRELQTSIISAGRLIINSGTAEVKTSQAKVIVNNREACLLYYETFDLPFDRNEIISFTLQDSGTGDEICGCSYDLWAALRLHRESIRGDLWLLRGNATCGKLRLQITFLAAVPKPWPDACLIDISSIQTFTFGVSPQSVSVRDATAYGNSVEGFDQIEDEVLHDVPFPKLAALSDSRTEDVLAAAANTSESYADTVMKKRFHIGRTYGLRYFGQPAIWLDVAINDYEVWQCELVMNEKTMQAYDPDRKRSNTQLIGSMDPGVYRLYSLMHLGREVGVAEMKLRYITRPDNIMSCTYIKLEITDLTKIPQHLTPCPRSAHMTVDLDHKNTVQCPPVKILGSHQLIDSNWIAPYRQQPIIRFTLRNEKGYPLSSADLNIWDVLISRQEGRSTSDRKILIPLYQRSGQKGGKVYIRLDFICHPKDLRAPKQILIGFSHAVNLGGEYNYESIDAGVRIRSGNDNSITPPKTANNLWGNWSDLLDLARNDYTLVVEVFNRSSSAAASEDILGSLYVHIWDLFRNPYVEWSGGLRVRSLKQDKDIGTIYLAMRLIIPQKLVVRFGSIGGGSGSSGYYYTDEMTAVTRGGYFVHAPLKYTKISPSNTTRDIRRKFIAACREISQSNGISDEDRLKYKYVHLTPHAKTAHLDISSGTKILLPEDASLLTVFPECLDAGADKPKVIDLAIVSIKKKKKPRIASGYRSGQSMTLNRAIEIADEDSVAYGGGNLHTPRPSATSDDQAQSDSVSCFPLGETIQTEVKTLPRDELAWCARNSKLLSDRADQDSNMFATQTSIRLGNGENQQQQQPMYRIGGGLRANKLSELCERTFELHPNAYAPLGALGYAYLPFAELNRLRQNLKWTCAPNAPGGVKYQNYGIVDPSNYIFLRDGQFVPVVIHGITSANALISRISPTETVVGYDLPDYARTMHVKNSDVLPNLDESDLNDRGRKHLVYRNCGTGRATPYKSVGPSAVWTGPPIPRTNSMIFGLDDDNNNNNNNSQFKSSKRKKRTSPRFADF